MSISTAAGSPATSVRRRSALGGFIGGAMTRNALTHRGLTYVFVRRLISGRALNLATAHVNAETEGQLATVNRSADSYATGDNSAPCRLARYYARALNRTNLHFIDWSSRTNLYRGGPRDNFWGVANTVGILVLLFSRTL